MSAEHPERPAAEHAPVSRDLLAQMIGNAVAMAMGPFVARVEAIEAKFTTPIFMAGDRPITADERALLERHGAIPPADPSPPPTAAAPPPPRPDAPITFPKTLTGDGGMTISARGQLPNNYGTIRVVFQESGPPRIFIERPNGDLLTYVLQSE